MAPRCGSNELVFVIWQYSRQEHLHYTTKNRVPLTYSIMTRVPFKNVTVRKKDEKIYSILVPN